MKLRYFAFFSVLLLLGCAAEEIDVEKSAVILAGTNVNGFESCDWVIQFNNEFNTKVVPVSLDVAFQQNALEVQVVVTNSTELADCVTGNPVKVRIISIREAN